MYDTVQQEVAHLPKLSTRQLRELWFKLFGQPPRNDIRRELLIRALAYRIQEREYGGLKLGTQRKLLRLARQFRHDPNKTIAGVPLIMAGTQLIRDWRGKSYRVTARDAGYEYAGKQYSSLSSIARLITGTRWSGPLFFGLKRPGRKTDGR